jgi:hypothetical protein
MAVDRLLWGRRSGAGELLHDGAELAGVDEVHRRG